MGVFYVYELLSCSVVKICNGNDDIEMAFPPCACVECVFVDGLFGNIGNGNPEKGKIWRIQLVVLHVETESNFHDAWIPVAVWK